MERIDHFNLRSFDLNLMLSFDALFVERSVTRAAQRLHVRQPAMSHSLSTLRLLLTDELFIRVGSRMEPTPRAEQLAGPIRALLSAAQETLLVRTTFDPATERRQFRLGLSDQLEALMLPGLIARIRSEAPFVKVMTRTTSREHVFEMLEREEIDFAIGSFDREPAWCKRARLFTEEHVCCFNATQLAIETPMTMAFYRAAAHALVSKRESMLGYMEEALHRAGVEPDVCVSTTNFFSLLLLAAQSPVVSTVPMRMANRFAASLGLTVSPVPFALEPFYVDLLWHQRVAAELSWTWMRGLIVEECSSI